VSVDSYSKKVLDHFRHPRNAGILEGADLTSRAENPACGDAMHLYARLDGERFTEVSCQTFGCAPAVAAGSLLTEMLIGHTLPQVAGLDAAAIESELGGLPPIKQHAAALAADVLKQLINDYSSSIYPSVERK
jgi:NifU-like protein involved in Fe-S cluster formation